MQSVFNTGLLFLHFDFGGSTDADQSDTAGELGDTFLELLTVVLGGSGFDLDADVLHAGSDLLSITSAVDDRGVFLADLNLLRGTKLLERGLVELQAEVRGDHLTAGQDGDVFKHGLAAIAEARSLDSGNLQHAAEGVHHEGGEGFTVDVFSDDHERTTGLGNLLENRQKLTDVADLLVVNQDVGVLEENNLLVRIVDEVGAQVAAVELHAFDDVELVLQGLAVFNGDHAFLADLVHRVSDDLADFFIRVGGNGADLGDFLRRGGRTGNILQGFDGSGDSLVDAALQIHRVHAGGNVLHAFVDDRLGENRSGGGAVTGVVGSLGGHFLHHLGAHILELVLQFDFLGDRDAVLRDGRAAEGALENNVAALRSEGHLNGVRESVDTLNHQGAGVIAEQNLFCHVLNSPKSLINGG